MKFHFRNIVKNPQNPLTSIKAYVNIHLRNVYLYTRILLCGRVEFMDFKIIRELLWIDENEKCNVLTCVHYAGGFCVGCDSDNECEFLERSFTQD